MQFKRSPEKDKSQGLLVAAGTPVQQTTSTRTSRKRESLGIATELEEAKQRRQEYGQDCAFLSTHHNHIANRCPPIMAPFTTTPPYPIWCLKGGNDAHGTATI
jgi:hypothetical protein